MSEPRVSIVIVNYKVAPLIVQLLRSLADAHLHERCEVIVVDNASQDESEQMVTLPFPLVTWIGLKNNLGFGKACNVGARRAQGAYVLFINPDTIISINTISECVSFLESHPQAGMVGPKILNPDGTLQASCRRSFPTPRVAFYHFSGISRLFPGSERFGRYNLTYLDPDDSTSVDAISGSFMFVRRPLFMRIGGFDEQFFMYGEDLDLCRRVRDEGFEVWYHPRTQIVHSKGKSSAKRSLQSRLAFYQAMVLFSRKYRHTHESFLPGWLILFGIAIQATAHLVTNICASLTATFIDLFSINLVLWGVITLRFTLEGSPSPYRGGVVWVMAAMHLLLSASFLTTYFYRGVYSRERYTPRSAFFSGLLAAMLFISVVYFIQNMAFSRIAFAGAALVIPAVLVGWRELLPRMLSGLKRLMFAPDRIIVLGNDAVARTLIQNIEQDRTGAICGIIWPCDQEYPGDFEGYPVLGTITGLEPLLSRTHADSLLVATPLPWYSSVIEALGSPRVRALTVRWVPPDLFSGSHCEQTGRIPLHDFTV